MTSRQSELDLLRGYLMVVMTINHLYLFPAWTRVFTGDNHLVVSAAEGFVLVSGIVVGMVYRGRAPRWGWRRCARHIVRRSLLLYGLAVAAQLAFSMYDSLLSGASSARFSQLAVEALLQRSYRYHALDLLPLYAVLLPVGFLVVLALQRKHTALVLAGSLLLWYLSRATRWGVWFHPGIWQLLFVVGVVVGFFRQDSRPWIPSRWLIVVAALVLVASYQAAFSGRWPELSWLRSDPHAAGREPLGLERVGFSLLIFGGMAETLRLWQGPIEKALGWLLLPLGRNALVAYVVQSAAGHLILTFPGYPFPNHDPIAMGFLHVAYVLVVLLLTLAVGCARCRDRRP